MTLAMLAGLVHMDVGPVGAQSGSNRDLRSLTVDGVSVANFSASRTSYEFGVDADQVTIVATAANSSASVSYSGTDQESSTPGHQIDLSDGRNAVTISVRANSQTKTYTLNVNRGVRSRGGWEDSTRGPVTSYQVIRRVAGGPSGFEVVGETTSPLTYWYDYTVEAGTKYVYRVKARNAGGLSGWSPYFKITTPDWTGNTRPTGVPVIEGTVQVGETLSVDASGIADDNGLDEVSYSYQWLAGGLNIYGATDAEYTPEAADVGKTISVRVFCRDDEYNETRTSEAVGPVEPDPDAEEEETEEETEAETEAPQLTATVYDVPDSHDGETAFTFELRFSEELSPEHDSFSYSTLRDHAFTVTGGTVTVAKRLKGRENGRNRNIRWQITVQPSSDSTVTIVLPVTEDCADEGAICTDDGKKFSSRLELTIPKKTDS